ASGTLTMELALLKVPMVVCYRVAMISSLLARRLIKVKFVSLVNLVADKEVVPELLQTAATPENIYNEMLPLLFNKESRRTMLEELARVCDQLGEPGASRRTAKLAGEMTGLERDQTEKEYG
ncbi:MAG: hypothetical protein R3297_06400, partial [Desulfobulbales bacterium]|nr:hypothetical protein [Desulfobulbales bacterium]